MPEQGEARGTVEACSDADVQIARMIWVSERKDSSNHLVAGSRRSFRIVGAFKSIVR